MFAAVNVFMRPVRNLADIDHRKQRKNQCLNKGNKKRERQQGNRNQKLCVWRIKIRDLRRQLLVGKHICKKSDPQREWPDHVAYKLYAKDQRSEKECQG